VTFTRPVIVPTWRSVALAGGAIATGALAPAAGCGGAADDGGRTIGALPGRRFWNQLHQHLVVVALRAASAC
jgi:hypothetical protein